PLAVALDMPEVTLVESKAKKAKFLAEACDRFAPTVKVLNVNAAEMKERYRQIIFCAFGSLNKIVRMAEPMLSEDGRILAYKGKREAIDQEIAECKARHKEWQIVPFKVPGLEAGTERHVCIYKSRHS
ncbi:MAG: class I SAM-dependent methyltransferase, partial [Planctomycetes bacterium]|nr:class I SAM-dependent methyltransferase [Planctomycetota bacterium]